MITSYIIRGIKDYDLVIEDVLVAHGLEPIRLGVRTVLTEGLVNAHRHGNQGDCDKCIEVIAESNVIEGIKEIIFSIKDCGQGFVYQSCNLMCDSEMLLKESGRGMFLIEQFAEEVTVDNNRLEIKLIQEEEE